MNKLLVGFLGILAIVVIVAGLWGYSMFVGRVPVAFLPAYKPGVSGTMSLIRVPFNKVLAVGDIKQFVSAQKNIPVSALVVSLLSVEFPESKILGDSALLGAENFDMYHVKDHLND